MNAVTPPVGVSLSADIEHRPDRRTAYRARVRWMDPATKQRRSKSEAFETEAAAVEWIAGLRRAALGGLDPASATMSLADYGTAHLTLALRGLEAKTLDPRVRLAQARRAGTRPPARADGDQRRRRPRRARLDR